MMGLDIWFPEDIRNALLAADEASAQTAAMMATLQPKPNPKELRAFRDGFKAALISVALAFGLAPQAIMANEVIAETGGTARRPGEVETHDRIYMDTSR